MRDSLAPVVSKVRLVKRRAVRFTVSEPARVTVRIARAHHKPVVVRRAVLAGRITLKLKRTRGCGRRAQSSKRKPNRLWAHAHGRFRTRGHGSSATVRALGRTTSLLM